MRAFANNAAVNWGEGCSMTIGSPAIGNVAFPPKSSQQCRRWYAQPE
ncbi:hypothetical protein BGS_0447 [Beggiatoa sp. SS]|nr:hypothetical protein BGS_0447 [Beggiatoa sp. SS]